MESALAGCTNTLFSEIKAAAVYWVIISPEFSPGKAVKKAGSSLKWVSSKRLIRRSEIFPISDKASFR